MQSKKTSPFNHKTAMMHVDHHWYVTVLAWILYVFGSYAENILEIKMTHLFVQCQTKWVLSTGN